MKDYGGKLRATKEFAAARGWTLTNAPRSDAEQRELLQQLHGEPFHPADRDPGSFPYPVLGRHRHLLSNVMRGSYRQWSAVVFAYARRQEVLDDGFGRRGWENGTYWIAALLDLPAPVTHLQVTPHTPAQPGVAIGDPRLDERFHVHTGDRAWAATVLRDLAPVLLDDPGRQWRISGTSILTWTYRTTAGVPLDHVDAALERLSVIAEHCTPATGR